MREIRKSGSEGGARQTNVSFLPLSITPAACTPETVMLPSDAAARLKNGSCEDDGPSRIHESRGSAAARKRGAQSSRL
jgi:hypothetical protein